jgi:phosphoheptose isomerase
LFFINYSQGRLINNISSLANVVMKMDEAEAKLIMAGMPASIKKASQLWESFLVRVINLFVSRS